MVGHDVMDARRESIGKGLLEVRDVVVDKTLQFVDVTIVGGIITVFLPVVHLFVDGPYLVVLSLRLPDGVTQTVDVLNQVGL